MPSTNFIIDLHTQISYSFANSSASSISNATFWLHDAHGFYKVSLAWFADQNLLYAAAAYNCKHACNCGVQIQSYLAGLEVAEAQDMP